MFWVVSGLIVEFIDNRQQVAEVVDEEEDGRISVSKTPLDLQVSACRNSMYNAIDEGIEAVSW